MFMHSCSGPQQAPVGEEQQRMGEPGEAQWGLGIRGALGGSSPDQGQARALRAVSSLLQQPRRGELSGCWPQL